jgi:hypothetical protein
MAGGLYRGPFTTDRSGSAPDLEYAPYHAPIGGFDADGDGTVDVGFGTYTESVVVGYGPFLRRC